MTKTVDGVDQEIIANILDTEYVDTFIKITTDAGVNEFEILKADISGNTISVYNDTGWNNVATLTGDIYEILDMTFDLTNDNSGTSKSFSDLSSGGTISFFVKKQINNNAIQVSSGKKFTDGTIQSNPMSDSDDGNPLIDRIIVSDYISVWIVTSEALTDLEIPVRMHYARRG